MATADHELGYLATPEGGRHPGVVMIHDVWGLADHTRDLARRLMREGFCVLAVDLYRRLDARGIEDPGAFIRSLPDPDMLAEIQAAIDALAGHARCTGRVGVTGFCMGGQYVILAACGCRGLSAAVSFYGMLSYDHGMLAATSGQQLDRARKPRSPLEAIQDLDCPLLGLFGEDDPFVPVSDVRELERRLAKTPHAHEIVLYAGAGHAFMNETRSEMYRPQVAKQAWPRMVAFFREHLAG